MASVSSLGRFAKAFVSISCHLLPLRCCYLWPLVVMAIVSFLIQVQATQTTLYKMLGQNMARDHAMKFCWIQCFHWRRHLASDAKSPNLKDGGDPRSLVLLHSCFSQDFHSHLDCSTLWWCASFLGPPTAASSDPQTGGICCEYSLGFQLIESTGAAYQMEKKQREEWVQKSTQARCF